MSKPLLDMIGYEPIKNSVMIVDSFNLSFRWKHMGAQVFAEDYVNVIKSLAKSYKADKIIIAADKGSSSYRREIYPEYKGHRKEAYKDQTQEEKDKFTIFIEEYERAIKLCEEQFIVLRYQGVEADDIAAYVATNKNDFDISSIWLISSDKDWDLLVTEEVSRFSFVTRKEVTGENWPYEVSPDYYLLYKCLMGDAGDNIKGIEGIGDKRATALANQYETLERLISLAPIKGTAKYIKNLNEGIETLKINKLLMDLISNPAITEEVKTSINKTLENLWI